MNERDLVPGRVTPRSDGLDTRKLTDAWKTLMLRAQEKSNASHHHSLSGMLLGEAVGEVRACLFAAMLIEGVLGVKLAEPLTVARDRIAKNL